MGNEGAKKNLIASLPILDSDFTIREWCREDVDQRAAWPSYPSPYTKKDIEATKVAKKATSMSSHSFKFLSPIRYLQPNSLPMRQPSSEYHLPHTHKYEHYQQQGPKEPCCE